MAVISQMCHQHADSHC